jgi:hypothetical protein
VVPTGNPGRQTFNVAERWLDIATDLKFPESIALLDALFGRIAIYVDDRVSVVRSQAWGQ